MRLARRGNHEKVLVCADQKLTEGTGRIVCGLRDLENSIQETDQILPGQIIRDERDRGSNRQRFCRERREGKIQETSHQKTEWRQQKRQKRAMEPDCQLPAMA